MLLIVPIFRDAPCSSIRMISRSGTETLPICDSRCKRIAIDLIRSDSESVGCSIEYVLVASEILIDSGISFWQFVQYLPMGSSSS